MCVVKSNISILGKVTIKKIKSYGIVHQIFTPTPLLWKKAFVFHNFVLCLYYSYNHQIWREPQRKNLYLLLLKCLEQKSGSWKVWLTAGIFTLTPPLNKRFKSSVLDHSDHLCIFMEKNIFFSNKIMEIG